ncbi:MAG: hypothetical protein RMX65_018050 [Nostoc sp. DedQUE01]
MTRGHGDTGTRGREELPNSSLLTPNAPCPMPNALIPASVGSVTFSGN